MSDRVSDLLGRMTIDEKVAQLGGVWLTSLVDGDRFDRDKVLATIPHGAGHVTRIGASTGLRPNESAQLMNDIQRAVIEGTRLGIPVVVHEESTGGYCARDATVFPQAIGLASTWDVALIERVATTIRQQMLAVGARHTLAPVLDVARDPRWGRVEETYGEDPYLCGAMGTAYVRGVQGDDLAEGVIATGKHFLGYGLPEGGMNHAPVHLGPRELREVYAEPFAAAIRDASLASIMNSYSSVDGLPCAGSAAILDALLREELGFDGVVVADYFAVSLLMTHHHVAADRGHAARVALEAGLDLELPQVDCYGAPLRESVDRGEVPMGLIDRAVERVLASKFRLGLFDNPYVDSAIAVQAFDTPADRELARTAAATSLVLLKNDGLLPLDAAAVGRVAVIGPAADDQRLLQGDYHYPAHAEIVFGSGGDLLPEAGGAFSPGPYYTPHVTPKAAVAALGVDVTDSVEGADVAVVCVGGRSGLTLDATVGEARDATDLRLAPDQAQLIADVRAQGVPVVVVIVSGRVHELTEVVDDADALLYAWCPGEEGGNGIADVLFGRVNPSGRLPVTLPRRVGQVPIHHDYRTGGGRSLFHGDYTDSSSKPLFAFGHGLSYTTFAYELVDASSASTRDPVRLAVRVTNTGARDGVEVVQLYARDEVASVARPYQQLVGFTPVAIPAGSSRDVEFVVHPSRLAFYDPGMRFVVEPGEFTFTLGAASDDIRLTIPVTLEGEIVEFRQREIVATQVQT